MADPTNSLNCYLVGGAVRDQLLGLDVTERDWVVVGATPRSMIELGFQSVGKDFPVFLHPLTNEEYALARTERKTAPGYRGFEVHSTPDVTLEQDLLRRDLTINAMARDREGKLIDPNGGQADIEKHTLRHVSAAFAEDPVRVLRVARFAARFASLGFQVADETIELMRAMVDSGEVNSLVAERVWAELHRALLTEMPTRFIEVLRDCGALARIFPEIDALFGVPQPEQHHPEIDTGIHTLMVLEQATRLSNDAQVRYAALVHDLGKALTPKEELPKHLGHEKTGLEPIRKMGARLRVPKNFTALALKVCRSHLKMHRVLELKSGTVLKLLEELDAFRNPKILGQFSLACEADARGRKGKSEIDYPSDDLLHKYFAAAITVDISDVVAETTDGSIIG
ncbi:MAG: multifunctional CCA addition/repair protein, partial [Gammaproteobacteria bacterium]|nr:multifunctional CCA addition/repair protein [Gammaproteobacteria bacterium]